MEIRRTRFKKEIVSEFLVPRRPSNKVLILCAGMPSVPEKREVMEFWAKKGFFVFFPRYRGTWESGGEFLRRSPHEDILDVINELPHGFIDLWSSQHYTLNAKRLTLYVLGGSFGGAAAILASRDPRVAKAVAISPVIDWRVDGPDEPTDKLGRFLPKGFGRAYRFSKKNWNRLSRGELYNPISLTLPPFLRVDKRGVDGSKLLLIHAKDDRIVPYGPTKKFAAATGAKLVTFQNGGHFGLSESIEPRCYKHIKKFFTDNPVA